MIRKLSITPENINRILLFLFPLVALSGVVVSVLLNQYSLLLVGTYLLVPLLLCPVVYYLVKSKSQVEITIDSISTLPLFKVHLVVFTIVFTITVILLSVLEIRPVEYYFIISGLAILILSEILLFRITPIRRNCIIFQMMALLLNILWGVNLKYYWFIGRTDPIVHVSYVQNLIQNGFVTPYFWDYQAFPLWHIISAIGIIITDFPLKEFRMMFLLNGIIFAFIILAVYKISNLLFYDERISLLVSLFTVFNPDILIYGMTSIPRSVESLFIVLLILTIFYHNDIRFVLVSCLLVFTIISYHSATMPFVLVILLLLFTFQRLFKPESTDWPLGKKFLLFAGILTLIYWIYYGTLIFNTLVNNVIIDTPKGIMTKAVLNMPIIEMLNYLQYAFLLFFLILGILWLMDSKKFSRLAKIFGLCGLILSPFIFPGPSALINKLSWDLNLLRFGEYCFLFIAILAALGFSYLFSKSNKLKIIAVSLLVLMIFFGISNDFVASDNPLFKRPFYTFYLIEDEITGLNTISNITLGYAFTDYVSFTYLITSPERQKIHILEVDSGHTHFFRKSADDVFIIRSGELDKRPLKFFTSYKNKFVENPSWNMDMEYNYNDLTEQWRSLENYNKIYMSKSVLAYT